MTRAGRPATPTSATEKRAGERILAVGQVLPGGRDEQPIQAGSAQAAGGGLGRVDLDHLVEPSVGVRPAGPLRVVGNRIGELLGPHRTSMTPRPGNPPRANNAPAAARPGRSVGRVTITTPPAGLPRTVGELRASGHRLRGVKQELRENLLTALRAGRDPWPGIVGFDATVLPQLERALLAGHDVVLLGERGQGKTRLLRTLVGLLDEWTPVIEGAELGEHPLDPITPASRRRADELGDDLPVAWRHRSERYAEKLATPDTSVGDLIGDVDPVKVAEGRTLGDPETIHFGLVPRAHRGIVAINELPDLAERIQVALLNVMEERDIQVRGYTLRLPLDVLLVAIGQPRGLHQPRPDHHAAEGPVRRRDPDPLPARPRRRGRRHPAGGRPGRRGPRAPAGGAGPVRPAAARVHRDRPALRRVRPVRGRRGGDGRRRRPCAAPRSPARTPPTARPVDLESVPAVLRGKLEFDAGEEGREDELLEHLLRRATADTARARLARLDLAPLADAVDGRPRAHRRPGAAAAGRRRAARGAACSPRSRKRLGAAGTEDPGPMASAVELALESLYLTRKLAKTRDDDDTVRYG